MWQHISFDRILNLAELATCTELMARKGPKSNEDIASKPPGVGVIVRKFALETQRRIWTQP